MCVCGNIYIYTHTHTRIYIYGGIASITAIIGNEIVVRVQILGETGGVSFSAIGKQ